MLCLSPSAFATGVRAEAALPFRLVVHHGPVTFGGPAALGEEGMQGREVNFVFRLERLASDLALSGCASALAHEKLGALVPMAPVEQEHEIKGFGGGHRLYSMAWRLAVPG